MWGWIEPLELASVLQLSNYPWRALCWARRVVDAAGQPFPGPFKFWRVTREAWILAILLALLLSVGKLSPTLGLLTTWPAARLALSDWMKEARSGGQAQGILIGRPDASLTAPSQSPVPVGLTPAAWPKSGTKASMLLPAGGAGAGGAGAGAGAGGGAAAGGGAVPSWIAFC
jgi:hypothetical protein